MFKKIGVIIALVLILVSCAPGASSVTPTYVSPLEYAHYDCDQIIAEMSRVSRRSQEIAGQVDKEADSKNKTIAVAAVVFWPAIFAVGGSSSKKQEYARLLGKFEALEQVSIEKKCGIEISRGQY